MNLKIIFLLYFSQISTSDSNLVKTMFKLFDRVVGSVKYLGGGSNQMLKEDELFSPGRFRGYLFLMRIGYDFTGWIMPPCPSYGPVVCKMKEFLFWKIIQNKGSIIYSNSIFYLYFETLSQPIENVFFFFFSKFNWPLSLVNKFSMELSRKIWIFEDNLNLNHVLH